jgi:hypothetical protein
LPLLEGVGVAAPEVLLDFLGVCSSSLMEKLRARGVARGVESSEAPEVADVPVAARWRGVEGAHSMFSRRWTGRLRERMDSAGCWEVDCERSRRCEGMSGKAVVGKGSSISSIGVGCALVPMVVQLKCDMRGGLPPVADESDDCLFVKSERAAVDKLNLLRGLASGIVRRLCGGGRFWEFSVAGTEGDCTGLRLNWFFAVTPRGSCDTALTEICDGARECDSDCE